MEEAVRALRVELERQMKAIAKRINNIQTDEDIQEFLVDALDIEIIKSLDNPELKAIGFDILLNYGSPQIYFILDRGEAKLVGKWGGQEVALRVDYEKAEKILEYINESY